MERKSYPSDVSDEEWALVAPYLTLLTEDAPQREHSLREVFNGLRWIVRAGAAWRMMPHDLPHPDAQTLCTVLIFKVLLRQGVVFGYTMCRWDIHNSDSLHSL